MLLFMSYFFSCDFSYLGGSWSPPFNPESHTSVTAFYHFFLHLVVLFFLPLEGFPPILSFDISEVVSPLETGREHAKTIEFFLSGYCNKKSFSSQYNALQYFVTSCFWSEVHPCSTRDQNPRDEGLTPFKIVLLTHASIESTWVTQDLSSFTTKRRAVRERCCLNLGSSEIMQTPLSHRQCCAVSHTKHMLHCAAASISYCCTVGSNWEDHVDFFMLNFCFICFCCSELLAPTSFHFLWFLNTQKEGSFLSVPSNCISPQLPACLEYHIISTWNWYPETEKAAAPACSSPSLPIAYYCFYQENQNSPCVFLPIYKGLFPLPGILRSKYSL